jgi:hypothetical protein
MSRDDEKNVMCEKGFQFVTGSSKGLKRQHFDLITRAAGLTFPESTINLSQKEGKYVW